MPAAQFVQLEAPADEYVPADHLIHDNAPAKEYSPAGQLSQLPEPDEEEYVLAFKIKYL